MPHDRTADSIRRFLGGRAPAEFVQTYWQKRPLLVRDAVPGFETPLTPEELAGLACEPDGPSRLVLEEGGDRPWELREGPFEEETFLGLPESGWSLLVQEVDRRVPAVHDLLELVSFLPRWRVDDVMVSYAPDAGSVGAHLDSYDVFLLQGLGRRRWQIEDAPRAPGEQELLPDLDVQVLADFDPDHEWVLEPGDVLYLPPRVPHYGVAEGDCMTYSIGFRAPSYRRIAMGFLQAVTERAGREERYADPYAAPREQPGRIAREDLDRVRSILEDLWTRSAPEADWFGRMVTTPQRGGHAPPPEEPLEASELHSALERGATLRRSEASRFAYRTEGIERGGSTGARSDAEDPGGEDPEDAGGPEKTELEEAGSPEEAGLVGAVLYVDGTAYRLSGRTAELAELIGEDDEPPTDRLLELIDEEATGARTDGALSLLTELYNEGRLYLPGGRP